MINAMGMIASAIIGLVVGAIFGMFVCCACFVGKRADVANAQESESIKTFNRGVIKGIAAGKRMAGNGLLTIINKEYKDADEMQDALINYAAELTGKE